MQNACQRGRLRAGADIAALGADKANRTASIAAAGPGPGAASDTCRQVGRKTDKQAAAGEAVMRKSAADELKNTQARLCGSSV